MGGKILSQEAIAPTDVDMHPVLTRIASEKPDMVYFPVFTAAAAQILRQAKETPGLEKTKLMGGGSLLSADCCASSAKEPTTCTCPRPQRHTGRGVPQ